MKITKLCIIGKLFSLLKFYFCKLQILNKMDFLKSLNIKDLNQGVSTGQQWQDARGEFLESYSPVDGKLIGKIKMNGVTASNCALTPDGKTLFITATRYLLRVKMK